MEKRYITAPDVERILLAFERRYGLSSPRFYEAHCADDASVDSVPPRRRWLWASMYRTHERLMGGGALADRIERDLEPEPA